MKFFKHFTDAQRGKSLRGVRRSLGMAGIGMYWNLVEACAEKMEKAADEEYSSEHCNFEFELGLLSECLGVKSGRVQVILNSFSEHSLLHYSTDNFIIKIEMPKLLESLDRDTKRARTERVPSAPKKKRKKEEKEIEEEEEGKVSTPSVLISSDELGPVPELASELLSPTLAFVEQSLQRTWLAYWGDKAWIVRTLEKCIAKRQSRRLSQKNYEWGEILTAWLFGEKTAPQRQSQSQYFKSDQEEHSGGEEKFKQLLSDFKVKSLTELLNKKEIA